MRIRLVRLTGLLAIVLAFTISAHAQDFHQLTADDFQGAPHTNTATVAYTHCSINFQYQAQRMRNYYKLDFNIQLLMNRYKSWMDKSRITSAEMMEEVLRHEQGHYIIAYMEQQELLRAVRKTTFYADYQSVAQSIFDRIDAKYRQLNLDYDADTNHMLNRTQQESWNAYFRKRLEFMPGE